MTYRICKTFEIESGHMLSKHTERCRFPHGHSRRIEIVLSGDQLDANDMVCDFKTIKLALGELLDQWDHALLVNSDDPVRESLGALGERIVVFQGRDPTTEVLAEYIFTFLSTRIASDPTYSSATGGSYRFPAGLKLDRVRVWETSSSWAEYADGAAAH
ncbi:MAG: 6-carboxytetrahydropterin synthase [Phycisphaerales bacterium]|nr:6-carboxytetrahydropterin synthase [Phycisphaerales bacterium]